LLALDIDRPGCGFRIDMFQARTNVRLLKYLGIGLVALPEPVTTAFGVGLLFTANYLSQKLEPGLDNRFIEASAYQSYWFKRSSNYADGESSAQGKAKRYTQSAQQAIPWQYGLIEASAYQSYWFKRSSNYADGESSAPGKVKRYTQSEQQPIPWQYEGNHSLEANPNPLVRQTRRDTRGDIVHHTIDTPMPHRYIPKASRRETWLAQIVIP